MPLEPAGSPSEVPTNPYLPAGTQPLVMETFGGVNTATTRAGVGDDQCYWLDGFMPQAPRNLRAMYGVGTTLYNAASAASSTVVWFGFANIGTTPYCIIFLANGKVVAVNTNTSAATTILATGAILSPSIVNTGLSQWGSQYVIIVADQPGGYWLWDGTNVFTAGTLGPLVTITNVGAAYKTVPNVIITGGHGSGAVIAAAIANGIVVGATVTNPGSGYLSGDTVSLTFSGGNSGGSGGSITAILSGGTGGSGGSLTPVFTGSAGNQRVASVTINAGGSGYTSFAVATVVGGSPTAAPTLQLTIAGGAITAVTVVNGGIYELGTAGTSITITDSGLYYVSSGSVVAAGSGYSPSAGITFVGGGSVVTAATGQLNLANGTITSVSITSGGGYGSNTAPTVTITDTATTATATAQLMPFGIQGTCVEVYAGRVWVAKQATIYYSGPGSFVNFATSVGGGNFTSSDSFLKVGFSRLVQTNGFLYLVADSSVNYISGVQTSGSPPTTTFTNQNADPEVGSPYPQSVILQGQNILFANSVGVYVLNGSRAVKVSDFLDNTYNSVANFGGLSLSSAAATIFGRKVWMTLTRIVDPVSGSTVNKLLIWDGKRWWASPQDITLTYVKHQEINSVVTVYGTNGTIVTPLFSSASTAFQKTVQSRYWDTPGGLLTNKGTSRFFGLLDYYTASASTNLTISIDGVGIGSSGGTVAQFTNSNTYTITGPSSTGYFVTPPQAVGQQGVLQGMTIKTNAADVSLVMAAMLPVPVEYRG